VFVPTAPLMSNHGSFATQGSNMEPSQESARPGNDRCRILWFDVTDVYDFLASSSSVTGIQRVVASIISEIDIPDLGDSRSSAPAKLEAATALAMGIGLCRYDFERDTHVVVSHRAFLTSINRLKTSTTSKTDQDERHGWLKVRRRMGAMLSPSIRSAVFELMRLVSPRLFDAPSTGETSRREVSAFTPCRFQPGDTMIFLGAFWFRPFFMNVLLRVCRGHDMTFALLINDLIPVRYPIWFSPAHILQWSYDVETGLRNADLILTGSQHSAQDLRSFCAERGIALPRQAVLRWGDLIGKPESDPTAALQQRTQRYRNPGYVLMVSSIDRRKNQRMLINVWQRLHDKYRDATPFLILIGKLGTEADAIIDELRRSNNVSGRVVILSDVRDDELSVFYQHALFTVFPSIMEGWGLPVAESVAHGKLCLASNASSIPEVAGSLAQYFDPNDEHTCFDLIERYCFDDAARDAAERAIRENYRPSSWRQTAQMLIEAVSPLSRFT
jgi:glycosyltransferase involved in cell wall biosynthesis